MKIREIEEIVSGKTLTGNTYAGTELTHGFSSDLMSDVLTLDNNHNLVLITGLNNMQAIRTAEMSDIQCIVFVRGKQITEDMISLGKENGIALIQSNYSMFRASGKLFKSGLKPIF